MTQEIPVDPATFFVLLRDALDLMGKQVFTKTDTGLQAQPHSSVLIQEFAEKHGMTVSQGSDFIRSTEAIDAEMLEALADRVQILEDGAKASNMEFREYTEAYFKGIDLNNPPQHNKH